MAKLASFRDENIGRLFIHFNKPDQWLVSQNDGLSLNVASMAEK